MCRTCSGHHPSHSPHTCLLPSSYSRSTSLHSSFGMSRDDDEIEAMAGGPAPSNGPATAESPDTVGAVPGGPAASIGPIKSATRSLPADTAGCGWPYNRTTQELIGDHGAVTCTQDAAGSLQGFTDCPRKTRFYFLVSRVGFDKKACRELVNLCSCRLVNT